MMTKLSLILGAVFLVSASIGSTTRESSRVERLLELGRSIQGGECDFDCRECAPPLLGHEVDGLPFGGYSSSHPEPCNDYGTCWHHSCILNGPETGQAFLDGLENTDDAEMVALVRAMPDLLVLDDTRRALLVRSCRAGEFAARFPLSSELYRLLTASE